MACLCSPTTHEGSFRCRLHRGAPQLVSHSAQSASKGPLSRSCLPDISAQPCHTLARVRAEPPSPTAASPAHQINCDLPSFSSSSSTASTLPSPCLPRSCSARPPPPTKPAISSCTSPSRSLYPGSSSSELSAATQCTTHPSASHAAALAIMKHHLHNKHTKNHANLALRCSGVHKIGPSRLSRMGRACTDQEVPLLKKVDCCTCNSPPRHMLALKPCSFNSDEPQWGGLTSMEATQINFKMHSSIAKFMQGESSCKIMGYKAGPFTSPLLSSI